MYFYYFFLCNHPVIHVIIFQLIHSCILGYYMYIETSAPRRPNDNARLISTTYTFKGRQCVTFWYHMYGSNIGTLNVYAKRGNRLGAPQWTKSTDQGNKWNKAQVTINNGRRSRAVQVNRMGVFENIYLCNFTKNALYILFTSSYGSYYMQVE